MHELRLVVNGTQYGGWKSVRVQRGIEQIAGTFELGITELWPDQATERRINAADKCALLVDGEAVITGYVDDVGISHDKQTHSVSVAGRDAAGDLVDCSAINKTGQWANRKIEQIATDLCAPFGIKVRAAVDTGKSFASFALQEGESAFEAIERMARARALLLTSDGLGGLVITRAGNTRVATQLLLGENILEASGGISVRDRYSQYVVKGQAPGKDWDSGKSVSQIKGAATDPAVTRYRPLLVVAESQGDGVSLKDRAQWEATVRAARATEITVKVQGWAHKDGLWQPNTVVHVRDDWMHIDDDLLIRSVTFTLDEEGSVTELSLTRPDAFKLMPQPDPAAGSIWKWAPKEGAR